MSSLESPRIACIGGAGIFRLTKNEKPFTIFPRESIIKAMKTAVVGGGASGMVFAIECARRGGEVTLYERHGRVGKSCVRQEAADAIF